ncbi:MAG TPA: butyrate kinase [Terracidiphilus sp.]|jgi:butyrate kinase|nr:butyrate kinase [Terracidiphilus sp.]
MPPGEFRILAINPGSTSTKFAVYRNQHMELVRNLCHTDAEMEPFRGKPILAQIPFRQAALERELHGAGYALDTFHAVAGRGGLLRPVPSGTYRVNDEMLKDLRLAPYGEHASNMGAFLALAIAGRGAAEAFVVDPVSVDELCDKARISGSALVERRSLSHALNTKAVARRYAREQRKAYADLRLIVAHLGSGISVSAHQGGRMIDVNLAGQEGPFSTERCGGLQLLGVVQLCFSGQFTEPQLWNTFIREGGMYSYLGTKDLREVERRIAAGDSRAELIFDAMAYQVAREIGAMATVLEGRVDALLLTGGMARSHRLIARLRPAVEWIAPMVVYPGEDELQALAEGALRVLRGEEQARAL